MTCITFRDFVCTSPAGNDSEVDAPHSKRNRTGPETSQLLKDFASTGACESTAPLVSQPGTCSSKTFQTGRFEDCLSELAVAQASDKITRRRKRFSIERKEEADNIRKATACIRCRLTKTAVSIGEVLRNLNSKYQRERNSAS